ncbi:MAG: DinB family protein [Saprospiraceae bacterium]|nr:DinB family protein [Saprospiraceae bacterium]
MKNLLVLLVLAFPFFANAQDDVAQTGVEGMFAYASGQVEALAEAIPEDKYDWSPAEGVRSVKDAILHVASANYFFMTKLGFELPEGVDMMSLGKTEKKDDVVKILKESNTFVKEKIPMVTTASLGEKVEMPFGDFNRMSTLLLIMEHTGEHKGQLIAYARANGITPPWSE